MESNCRWTSLVSTPPPSNVSDQLCPPCNPFMVRRLAVAVSEGQCVFFRVKKLPGDSPCQVDPETPVSYSLRRFARFFFCRLLVYAAQHVACYAAQDCNDPIRTLALS